MFKIAELVGATVLVFALLLGFMKIYRILEEGAKGRTTDNTQENKKEINDEHVEK